MKSDKVALEASFEEMLTKEFWEDINSDLTISEYPFRRKPVVLNISPDNISQCVEKIKAEGYFRLESVLPKTSIRRMEKAIINLVSNGIPPAFIYMYDEPWQAFKSLSPVMDKLLGPNYRLGISTWAWHIPATSTDAGFSPHRDDINVKSIRDDGTPLMATAWIPLSDVTTDHSCMYVLPTSKDENFPDNLSTRTISTENLKNIRALPCKAGSVLSWNANLLHWGSQSSPQAKGPRTSLGAFLKAATEMSTKSVSLDSSQALPLKFRLAVIGEVMLNYHNGSFDDTHYPEKLLKLCAPFVQQYLQKANISSLMKNDEIYVYEFKKNPQIKQEAEVVSAGRNDPCPCGSGKKFKKCHGLAA